MTYYCKFQKNREFKIAFLTFLAKLSLLYLIGKVIRIQYDDLFHIMIYNTEERYT